MEARQEEGKRIGDGGEGGPGLRRRKKALTYRAIEDSAFDLFLRQGFDATTVEQIAEGAMVSRRTFFRYFGSKEDVLFAGEREEIRRAGRLLLERPAGEPLLSSLEATTDALAGEYARSRERRLARARLIADNPALLAAYMALMRDLEQEVAEFLSRRLDRDLGEGSIRLMAAVFVAVYRASVLNWAESGGKRNLSEIISANLQRLAGGLLEA